MKQKNTKWIFYILMLILLGGILYLGFHNVTPVSKHIEKEIKAGSQI